MGVNIEDYLIAERQPVQYPGLDDIKVCELPGCDVRFHVPPRQKGLIRYCEPHRVAVKQAKSRARYIRNGGGKVVCLRCGEKKKKKAFPKSTQGRSRMGTCIECQPFYRKWANHSPQCGEFVYGDDHIEFVGTCPLYKQCRARALMGLWLPCASPFRLDLLYVNNLPDDQYLRALDLLECGFSPSGEIEKQGFEYWVNKWNEVINA